MGKKPRRGKALLKVKISEASKTISNLDDANGSASHASEANMSQYLPKWVLTLQLPHQSCHYYFLLSPCCRL
ncbi:hypothetical protein JVU11DRAFT_3143 [Chiua virens]|nr:hypothetical protein JVU11DRAFT_3143 [Chiua virens]